MQALALRIYRCHAPGAQSGGSGPDGELREARVRRSGKPKKNASESWEQQREPRVSETKLGPAAQAARERDGQAGEPDGQRDLERGAVAKGMIQPIAEPAQALGVYKMGVGTASPGMNGERVPPRGGERRFPRNREREDGGGEKRIAAQDNRASKPGQQQ